MVEDYQSTSVRDFGGSRPSLDAPDVELPNALSCANVEFLKGQVSTRKGFGIAYQNGTAAAWPNEAMRDTYNWLHDSANSVVWFKPATGVRYAAVSSPNSISTIMTTTLGVTASYATDGPRLYAGFITTAYVGADSGQVFQFGQASADHLFPPPITYGPGTITQPGVGSVTKGVHYLGYVIETRTGFQTIPSPASSATVFVPIAVTAAGGRNIQWTLNTTWPTYANKVHVIMTTVANPNRWFFVPGMTNSVPGGSALSITFTIDITDTALGATDTGESTSAMKLLKQFTQTTAGADPFKPTVIRNYNNRMCYLTEVPDLLSGISSGVYISDPANYQSITADQHLIQAPGRKPIRTMMPMRDGLYLLGPKGTYLTHDTGDVPSLWNVTEVDGGKGTLSPHGATVSQRGDFGWVADQAGLYLYNGTYPDLPTSYYQSTDWDRINWNAAYLVHVIDNESALRVMVLAPLDGSTTTLSALVWDYTNGTSFDKIRYCGLYTISGYNIGAGCVVQNDWPDSVTANKKKLEFVLGPTSADAALRQMSAADTAPWRDSTASAIDMHIRPALFPGPDQGQVLEHFGAHMRLRGNGTPTIKAYSLDDVTNKTLRTVTLSNSPGKDELLKVDMRSEAISYDIRLNAVDEWIILSSIKHYFTEWLGER